MIYSYKIEDGDIDTLHEYECYNCYDVEMCIRDSFKTSDLGTALEPYLYQIADEMKKYCPVGAANDPYGTNNQWYGGVSAVYKNLTGGDVASADLGSGVESDLSLIHISRI